MQNNWRSQKSRFAEAKRFPPPSLSPSASHTGTKNGHITCGGTSSHSLCASGKGFLEKSITRASWAHPAQQGEGAQPIRWLRLGKQAWEEVLAGFLGCLRDAACRTRGAVASIDTCAIQRFSKPTPQPLGQSVAAQRRATRATQDSTTRETSCCPRDGATHAPRASLIWHNLLSARNWPAQ